MEYHIGDNILCRVNQDESIIFDIDWNDNRYQQYEAKLFEVISIYIKHYVILVYNSITNGITLDLDVFNDWIAIDSQFKIDKKYFGSKIFLVRDIAVGGRKIFDPYKDPINCEICLEQIPWAVPNQQDGSFICFVCRSTRIY